MVALGSYLKSENKNYRKGLDSIINLKSEAIGFKTMSYGDVMKLPEERSIVIERLILRFKAAKR